MVTKEKDEDLTLFLELRRHGKGNFSVDHELDSSIFGSNNNSTPGGGGGGGGGSPVSKQVIMSQPTRKTAADKFLNSVAHKSDYEWLITPPGTPLVPYLDKEAQIAIMNEPKVSNARPTALKERLANVHQEPASRNNMASKILNVSSGGLNSSMISNRRASRPATPTGRPTIPATSKPSRPSTPTSRPILPSTKPSAHPSRASTPTRCTARSSTPTARPSAPISRPTSRAATPARHVPNRSSAPSVTAPPSRSSSVTRPVPPSRSSSVTRSVPPSRSSSATRSAMIISKTPAPSRGTSPTVKSRPWKPSDMPGFSLDPPPNLRTSMPERPGSVSRSRPGDSSSRSSSVDSRSSGRPRQQSRSPTRGRPSYGSAKIHSVRRAQSKDEDHVSPVVMGSKMVERVVNMRKLAPPKQADLFSSHGIGKCSSTESLGFGRNLSKKSLEMAMRHMDIRRSISGNLRPIMTNIPASSMYSVRSESTRSRTTSVSDSPLATSSNASSEFSINNNFISLDSREMEDDN
ncbi:hypothetical protein ACFE04_012688 [Oxalis oulophora]